MPQEEQVYVLKECPPALSVGKAVQDQGCLFVWDPKESGPYFVPASEVHRCKLKVPRGARLNASRVVEYVPQFDERLSPLVHQTVEQLSPVEAAASPSAVESDAVSVVDEDIGSGTGDLTGYVPTEVATSDEELEAGYLEEADDFASRVGAQLFRSSAEGSAPSGARESAAVEPPSPTFSELFEEGAATSARAPKKPEPSAAVDLEDDKPLIDLVDPKSLKPPKRETLMAEAKSAKHLLTHFPKNPFCRICSFAKTTSMKVAKKPDTKSDDLIDVPTASWQQIATDDVIMARGDDHRGIGTWGVVFSHHVVRDVFSGARVAYPMSRRTLQNHAKNFRHFFGLRPTSKPPVCLVKMDEAGELEGAASEVGLVPETSLPNRWPHNSVLERDVREEKECCRSIHLQSGFALRLPHLLLPLRMPLAFLRPSEPF